ncbi:hypothetical protein [Cellvibrio sp. BR]|uniref:hypothetical protein n=1 Tax=Cellvibrio sp. BR TaxID=1134474 RepID=UPI00058F7EF1|nr:hypothetical protein [Cellvibrio sp. BR]
MDRVYIFLFLIMFGSHALCQDEGTRKVSSGYVQILYNDSSVLRRSLNSAPVIGEGNEDYSVKIGCMGKSDCVTKIRSIYGLLSTKKRNKKKCITPIYIKVSIAPDSVAFGESITDEIEVYEIDYTGKCVNYLGSSFKIEKSIYDILNEEPVKNW